MSAARKLCLLSRAIQFLSLVSTLQDMHLSRAVISRRLLLHIQAEFTSICSIIGYGLASRLWTQTQLP